MNKLFLLLLAFIAISGTVGAQVSWMSNASYSDHTTTGDTVNYKVGSFFVVNDNKFYVSINEIRAIVVGFDGKLSNVTLIQGNIRNPGTINQREIIFPGIIGISYSPSAFGLYDIVSNIGSIDTAVVVPGNYFQIKIVSVKYKNLSTGTVNTDTPNVYLQKIFYKKISYSGISSDKNISASIRPNPVQSVLHIAGMKGEIIVTTMLGKVVFQTPADTNGNTEINTQSLDKGVYILRTENGVRRFIKE
jgi:hypothetical protein